MGFLNGLISLETATPMIKGLMQKNNWKSILVHEVEGKLEFDGYAVNILEQYNILLEKCKSLQEENEKLKDRCVILSDEIFEIENNPNYKEKYGK